MSNKRALITGITGQDGSYLAEHLLNLGYDVHGIVRRNSVTENQQNRIEHIADHVKLYYGDMMDRGSVQSAIEKSKPDEIYNLAAQSHVRVSYDVPEYTMQVNSLGVTGLLEMVRSYNSRIKVYQASSSEMFGNSIQDDGSQNELTPMHPVSPYGCSKLAAYSSIRNYRKAYGMFASNGILFNHESPRRGSNFVTSKIVKNAVLISKRKLNTLTLGNLDSRRDWGHSRDYVRAMHLILQHDVPDDFVIATGITHSVREFCDITFSKLGLDYRNHIVQDPKFMRPEELNFLRGDATKANTVLNWKPETTFDQLIDEMIEFWKGVL